MTMPVTLPRRSLSDFLRVAVSQGWAGQGVADRGAAIALALERLGVTEAQWVASSGALMLSWGRDGGTVRVTLREGEHDVWEVG